jgi:hypothetical protein
MKNIFIFISILTFAVNAYSQNKKAKNTSNTAQKVNEVPASSMDTRFVKTSPEETSLSTPSVFTSPSYFGLPTYSFLSPRKGTEIELSYNRSEIHIQTNYPNSSTNQKTQFNLSQLKIAYAINSKFFMGASVGQLEGKGKSNSSYFDSSNYDIQGVDTYGGSLDPILNAGLRLDAQPISMILGLGGLISSGTKKSEFSYSIQNQNSENYKYQSDAKLGGNAIIPSLSVFTNDPSKVLFGAHTNYQILDKRNKESLRTDSSLGDSPLKLQKTKVTKGNIFNLSLFLETPEDILRFGFNANYLRAEASKIEEENINISYDTGALSLVSLGTNMTFKMTKNVSLIPHISIGTVLEGSSKELTVNNLYTGVLNLRANF